MRIQAFWFPKLTSQTRNSKVWADQSFLLLHIRLYYTVCLNDFVQLICSTEINQMVQFKSISGKYLNSFRKIIQASDMTESFGQKGMLHFLIKVGVNFKNSNLSNVWINAFTNPSLTIKQFVLLSDPIFSLSVSQTQSAEFFSPRSQF